MRIGVLGGTFDPIHIGHLILAEQAREQLGLDKVLFIPAGEPWRKTGREITDAAMRLEMTRLAVVDAPGFEVDDCEVRRSGPSYTLDTLRDLRGRIDDGDEMFLLLGADALADLPNWHDAGRIADYATLAVAPREGSGEAELPFDASNVVQVEMPYIAVSSTDLRTRARQGGSLRYLVPERVNDFIQEKGVYRAG